MPRHQLVTPLRPLSKLSGASSVAALPPQLNLTQINSDNFNRANGSIAGANKWVAISTGSMSISSNELIGAAGNQLGDYRTNETYSNDQYSQCAVGTVALVAGGYIGVSVRNQDNANCYLGLLLCNTVGSNYQVQLFKKVAGTYTLLSSSGTFATPAAGAILLITAQGPWIAVSLNSFLIYGAAARDTTFPTGGTAGIESFNANSLDTWQGGNLTTGPTGAALATDNFTRADGNVSVGSSGAWVLMNYPYAGGATVECNIASNQISVQSPPISFHAGNVRTDAYNSDHWSAIQMGTTVPNAAGFVGVTVRNQGSGGTLGNSGYLAVMFHNNAWGIYRLDNGASTMLAVAAGPAAANDPAGTEYKLVAKGSRISMRANGYEILSVTDATYTGGAPGIMMYPNATADNWSAGNV